MGFFIRPFIVNDPGVTGCPKGVSCHHVPVSCEQRANLARLGFIEHSIRPCPQVRYGTVGSSEN